MSIANEKIGRRSAGVANFENAGAMAEEAAHVTGGPEADTLDDAERHDRGRVAMHDRHDIRPQAIDLAMNESLKIDAAGVSVERRPVEVELDDVRRFDRGRR